MNWNYVRIAKTIKYTMIVPDFGSSSRPTKEGILTLGNFWYNPEDMPKDKSDGAD